MNTNKILLHVVGTLFFAAALNAATRVYNDPDSGLWTDNSNWSGSVPNASNADAMFEAGNGGAGKTTHLAGDSELETVTVNRLYLQEGTLIISDIVFNHNGGYVVLGGTAGGYSSELILSGKANFDAPNTYIGDSSGVKSTLTIQNEARYAMRGGTFYVGAKSGSTGILNVEKGGTLNANSFFTGWKDSAENVSATVNLKGLLTASNTISLSDAASVSTEFNIYGSGRFELGSNTWITGGATVTFCMEDISSAKISKEGEELPTEFFWTRTSGGLVQDEGSWIVDFNKFSVDSSESLDSGMIYMVGLISESKNLINSISVINESALGEWSYEGLINDGNNVYVKLGYTAVPEPASSALVFGSFALLFARYGNRRTRSMQKD